MNSKNKFLVVGNWKANPDTAKDAKQLFAGIKKQAGKMKNIETVICPSYLHLPILKPMAGNLALGAQDFFYEANGSFTGSVGYEALLDQKIKYAIIGHSERRAMGETDEIVGKKLLSAVSNSIRPILCVGEKSRDTDLAYLNIIKTQLVEAFSKVPKSKVQNVLVAYEPIWAIGKNATRDARPPEIKEVVIFIKRVIGDIYKTKSVPPIKILYGGSVDAKNAGYLMEDSGIDGFLVGRASLDAKTFGLLLGNINESSSRK